MKPPTRLPLPALNERQGFEPTFPLDEAELRHRLVLAKMAHPFSWLAPVALGLAALAFTPPLSALMTTVASVAIGAIWVRAAWRHLEGPLRVRVERAMICESNRLQNERLRGIMRAFRTAGAGHYAEVLAKFLREKRRCEEGIGGGEGHFATVEKMENLVDGLCSGACRELDYLMRLDRYLAEVLVSRDSSRLVELDLRRRRHLETVFDAYAALADGAEMLEEKDHHLPRKNSSTEVETPLLEPAGRKPSELHRAIEDLRDETAIARRVRERLASDTDGVPSAVEEESMALSA